MLQRLVDAGNSIVVIEHNLDVIKVSDYLIDLGPEGGDEGGSLIATGTPEQIAAAQSGSYTGSFLKPLLGKTGEAARPRKRRSARTTWHRRDRADRGARLWLQKWRWYERNRLPWNRARIHYELARRQAYRALAAARRRARDAA